jgi:hypothetical protein
MVIVYEGDRPLDCSLGSCQLPRLCDSALNKHVRGGGLRSKSHTDRPDLQQHRQARRLLHCTIAPMNAPVHH